MRGTGRARRTAAPAYRQPRPILLVFGGGVLGAAARAGLSLALPVQDGGIPWAILIANLSGAFLLGLLLTTIAVHAVETPARRELRLFAGTGVLGGFTTYSSLATGSATLIEGDPWLGAAYALGTVVLGLAAAALGVWAGELLTRGRVSREGAPEGDASGSGGPR